MAKASAAEVLEEELDDTEEEEAEEEPEEEEAEEEPEEEEAEEEEEPKPRARAKPAKAPRKAKAAKAQGGKMVTSADGKKTYTFGQRGRVPGWVIEEGHVPANPAQRYKAPSKRSRKAEPAPASASPNGVPGAKALQKAMESVAKAHARVNELKDKFEGMQERYNAAVEGYYEAVAALNSLQ